MSQHIQKAHPDTVVTKGPQNRVHPGDDAEAPGCSLQPEANSDLPIALSKTDLLLQAANAGNAGLLEILIRSSEDLATVGSDGSAPLHCAARAGHSEIVTRFIDIGAEMEVRNDKRRTPLHEAVLGQDSETVAVLLAKKADIWAVDNRGISAFRYILGSKSETLVQMALDLSKEQLMRYELRHVELIRYGTPAIIELLMNSKNSTVNSHFNQYGHGLLIHAIKLGREEMVRCLLSNGGINVNQESTTNSMFFVKLTKTALAMAASHGRLEITKLLLAQPTIDINKRSIYQWERCTPSEIAVKCYHSTIALTLMADKRHEIHAHKPTSSIQKNNCFYRAVREGYSDIVKLMLKDTSIQVNSCPGWVRAKASTSLHLAVLKGHLAVLEILIQSPRIHINMYGFYGTALHVAVSNRKLQAIQLLLRHKDLDLNVRTWSESYTPLHLALLVGFLEGAQLLLEDRRTDINLAYSWGYENKATPLDMARKMCYTNIVDILEKRGAIAYHETDFRDLEFPNIPEHLNPDFPDGRSVAVQERGERTDADFSDEEDIGEEERSFFDDQWTAMSPEFQETDDRNDVSDLDL